MSVRGSSMSMPSTMMLPADGSSSRLRQRSSVDLPEPDGPDDEHQLALGHLQVDALQHVQGAEMLVEAPGVDDRPTHPSEDGRIEGDDQLQCSSCGVGS